jgi:hypothetical protein
MDGLHAIASFFKGLGHLMGKALHLVHQLVPEEQMAQGKAFVEEAALKFEDNADRRHWVVGKLQALGVPESIARLICELGVMILKKETKAAIAAAD